MNIKPLILSIVLIVFLGESCSTNKENNLAYFKDLAVTTSGMLPDGVDSEIRLIPDNELAISISSAQPEATAMYNVPLGNPATRDRKSVV